MKPEQRARQKIDQLLEASGWIVQSRENLNLGSGPGVALRELPSPTGPADYWLFINRELIGAVEAKPEGTTLSGVAEQSKRYQLVESQQQAGSLLYIEPAERMRQSILKQAFLGKLVPQDPSDEPAALLLERIKSKRAEREAEKRAVTKLVRQAASLSRA